ncbi:MAG: hypothetical protein ACYTFG_22180 [Planctomycetota bacterium]
MLAENYEGDQRFLYRAEVDGEQRCILSFVPPHRVQQRGLPNVAMAGYLKVAPDQGGKITAENFVTNEPFIDFLHDVIAHHAPEDPVFIEAVKEQKEGMIVIIDSRVQNPGGDLEMKDVFGWFQVEKSELVPDSYQRNPKHFLVSESGFSKLEPFLYKKLVAAFRELPAV